MIDRVLINSSLKGSLLAIQKTQSLIDRTTERLATGKDVNSALDDPKNFFEARALNNRASDLSTRLDSIGRGIRTVEEAMHGVEAIERLLQIAETVAEDRLEEVKLNGSPVNPPEVVPPLNTQILASNPVAYWRLNEIAGVTATNLGSLGGAVDGLYDNGPNLGTSALYANGGAVSAEFNGIDQGVSIPDNAQLNLSAQSNRTVELVFNADTVAGRQVLFEEGAGVNSLSIYIDNGSLYVNGRDQGSWGPVNISTSITAGQTYHVAFTFQAGGLFVGYVNGENIGSASSPANFPSHSGDIGIGFMNQASWFHDGTVNGDNFFFDGRISDVAVYNTTLTAAEIADHAAAVSAPPLESVQDEEFNRLLDQIKQITIDANYRGINLLADEDIRTLFNEDGSNSLLIEGVDFTGLGLGIQRVGFDTISGVEQILEAVRNALKEVRDYGRTLTGRINILKTRDIFTKNTVNILESGAQDLTNGDMNEEGANLLALQVRQQMAFNTLAIASQNAGRIADFLA